MGAKADDTIGKLAVIGAGNMGSGIAQKMATEGFQVILVDLDDERVQRGRELIRRMLDEGVERKVFRPEQAETILERVRGTADWKALADADLVVEAVFEDRKVKQQVLARLDEVCRPETILATNTSSLSVTDLARDTRHPRRVIGLHYFYHPAKNRLVEVIPGEQTDPALLERAWSLQEQAGKTPIASADRPGFVVNRFFVPWLNEAVRLLDEGVADIATIDAACKRTFGVGMGPFQLMNVTGVPIALHAATTLGDELGPFYAPAPRLAAQVESKRDWPLDGAVDESRFEAIDRRMLAVVFYVAAALVDEGVGTLEDTDIGARVGLRWPRGPFQMINRTGVADARGLVEELAGRWSLEVPALLRERTEPFRFRWIRREDRAGVAWLTVNRPDAMNALDEAVVEQLHETFRAAAADPDVRGIVIGGSGKAFIAGADIRFFVRNIEARDLDRIVNFTRAGHDLLGDIDRCAKPVIARVHGLTLGGGLELALACDRIVASPKAALAFPETGIGIYPGLGGTQRTPRRIGAGLAKWLVYTGKMLSATEAEAIGLVDQVVPHAELDAAIVREIERGVDQPATRPILSERYGAIERLFAGTPVEKLRSGDAGPGGDEALARAVKPVAYKAPLALQLAEKLIDGGASRSLDQGLQLELEHLTEIFSTADALEGLSSVGRRRPTFQGR